MHHANHFYGHAHLLARYCGLDEEHPPRIRGYLQHGWNILNGYAPGTVFVPGCPRFVWSDGPRRRSWTLGERDHWVIGAPWAYLLAMEPGLGRVPEEERTGTIWYPFHGWESQYVQGDHRRLIAEIKSVEPGPVTVCLYWLEYKNTEIRRVYESAGFRVICHGYRGIGWRKTDRRFLDKQLVELRRHRRVASNRMSSAVLYGVSVGCEAAVYGDPMILEAEDPAFGGVARMERLWPEMRGLEIDPGVAAEVTARELGLGRLATPAEIRLAFGWPEGGSGVR